MPEVGDVVQLLFPGEDEKYAYAASSVRQSDTGRTADPLVKYWRTTFGKEIKMNNKEILITARDDSTFIRINEDTGIEVITPNPVLVRSGSTINVESQGDMSISTERNLSIRARNSIRMTCGGNTMRFIPADGISMSTDREFELISDDNATIDGKSKITLKSGRNMMLDSRSSLIGSAASKIELSSSGASIMLDASGVDMKGANVNEN
jgi:hypothetical protein